MARYSKKKWSGGRISISDDGTRTYHIYRMRNGRRYSVSTRCTDERAALKEYLRWQDGPESYQPKGGEERLTLSRDLIDLYADDCRSRQLSPGRLSHVRTYLAWWGTKLPDLGRADLRDFDQALEGVPARGMRINVLKAFCSWLVRTGRLEPIKNVSALIQPPPSVPAQVNESRVIEDEDHEAVLRHLPAHYRDLAVIMRATGCHVSELRRFVAEGETDVLDKSEPNARAWDRKSGRTPTPYVIVFPHHKSKGSPHRIGVDLETWGAARRARKHGAFHRSDFYRVFQRACEAAQIEKPFTPGDYRATLATELVEAGAELGSVSAFLGHRSTATTRKFYATNATVPNPKTTIR